MSAPLLARTPRLRETPFSRRVEAAGAKGYTVYNHMLLPGAFRSLEEDYAHLKSAVQVWDVSVERQIEIVGPDALRLVQMTTPRDLARMADDQCYYVPAVDEAGRMLNDPVLLKLAEDRYWVSIADSDLMLYYKGLANGFRLNVSIFEPDVSPLAVQGPMANELIGRVFGPDIVATRFFRHKRVPVEGRDMVIARSGWSVQGGFEIYLEGSEHGEALWDRLFEAGADLDVQAGSPNLIERIEGGLLSYGSDITRTHTPFEAGLGRFCHLDTATACLGHAALLEQRDPIRKVRPLEIGGDPLQPSSRFWTLSSLSGEAVGHISSAVWSPDFQANIAIGTVGRAHWHAGTELVAETPMGDRPVCVRDSFWA